MTLYCITVYIYNKDNQINSFCYQDNIVIQALMKQDVGVITRLLLILTQYQHNRGILIVMSFIVTSKQNYPFNGIHAETIPASHRNIFLLIGFCHSLMLSKDNYYHIFDNSHIAYAFLPKSILHIINFICKNITITQFKQKYPHLKI